MGKIASFVARITAQRTYTADTFTQYAAYGQTAPHLLNLTPDYPFGLANAYPDPNLLPDPYLYGTASGLVKTSAPMEVFNAALVSPQQAAWYALTASDEVSVPTINYMAPEPQYLLPRIV